MSLASVCLFGVLGVASVVGQGANEPAGAKVGIVEPDGFSTRVERAKVIARPQKPTVAAAAPVDPPVLCPAIPGGCDGELEPGFIDPEELFVPNEFEPPEPGVSVDPDELFIAATPAANPAVTPVTTPAVTPSESGHAG